jgi:hypothetical protein
MPLAACLLFLAIFAIVPNVVIPTADDLGLRQCPRPNARRSRPRHWPGGVTTDAYALCNFRFCDLRFQFAKTFFDFARTIKNARGVVTSTQSQLQERALKRGAQVVFGTWHAGGTHLRKAAFVHGGEHGAARAGSAPSARREAIQFATRI